MDFRADPNKWDLYAQIQRLLRLIPLIFTAFSVSLLKHFFTSFTLKFCIIKILVLKFKVQGYVI